MIQNIDENVRQKIIYYLDTSISEIRLKQWLKDDQLVSENERQTTEFTLKCLLMATEEMKTRGSFHLLKEIVSKEHSKCNQIVTMKEAIDISKQNRTKLKHLFKEKNNRFLIESQKKNTIIIEQSNEFERLKKRNDIELTFTKDLLLVQIEENELKCEIEVNNLKEKIVQTKKDVLEEAAVHDQIIFYYNSEIKRLNELIAYWKDRYKDIEERKLLLKSLLDSQRQQHEELEFYKSLFDSRNAEIEEYLADKDRRKKEEEHEIYLNKMATRIQSWWRGIMVRRCLGPFKHLLKIKNAKKRKMSLKKVTKKT